MALSFITKIFGSRNDRLLKQYRKTVQRINAFEPTLEALSDAQLAEKTPWFRQQIEQGVSLNDLLPEAFAVVREASRRVMQMRHFDVQLMGGIALHEGNIAEMRTGEGKTLTATLPVYLNALTGKGVHLVTVNDYLASRDAQWMRTLYEFLGLTVGINLPQMSREEKQAAYAADITYGTNNEYGFDYLRDNMVYDAHDRVQRALAFAIVDEVDSILIDEARTPLIISGQAEDQTAMFHAINQLVHHLTQQEGEADPRTGEGVTKPGDFTLDLKGHAIHLTEQGHEHAEQLLAKAGLLAEGSSLYEPSNITLLHQLVTSLKAHHLYHRDQHYLVQDGDIVIVDEFTGRLMSGRRWSDGLHQAVEAKEGLEIQPENQTLASITFQNYFRLYGKLAGMTGTADTEAYEFQQIYGLETVVIPPNKPSIRQDQLDRVYKTTAEKYKAAIADIRECHERGQPVLVGTSSVENSEIIAQLLEAQALPHQVLNAKQHAKEADIITQAGQPGAITIATNMAGRGTDIMLGGNLTKLQANAIADDRLDDTAKQTQIQAITQQWQTDHDRVKALGGLRIIATERHESRRIDNQLRGRAGRQGDPGSSRFYLSLDDPLMRIFAGDRVRAIMDKLKMPEDEPIEAGMVTRSIETAQRKVEARNFDMRKQLLEYDDVANDQRKVIYKLRNDIIDAESLRAQMDSMRQGCFTALVHQYVPEGSLEEQWDLAGLQQTLHSDWSLEVELVQWVENSESITDEDVVAKVTQAATEAFEAKRALADEASFVYFERMVLLQNLDQRWRDHLSSLDYLRQGIHLRGYAQKQPKQEYKREAFELFGRVLDLIRDDVVSVLMNVQIRSPEQVSQAAHELEEKAETRRNVTYTAPTETGEVETTLDESTRSLPTSTPSVGRNDPCPCGSGKKYKHCHGKLK